MTVLELIREPQNMPQGAKVVVGQAPNDCYVEEATCVELRTKRDETRPNGATNSLFGCVDIS